MYEDIWGHTKLCSGFTPGRALVNHMVFWDSAQTGCMQSKHLTCSKSLLEQLILIKYRFDYLSHMVPKENSASKYYQVRHSLQISIKQNQTVAKKFFTMSKYSQVLL